MAPTFTVLLSESLESQRDTEGLVVAPQLDSLHVAAAHLGLYVPRNPVALLHTDDEEPFPNTLLNTLTRPPHFTVTVNMLSSIAVQEGFIAQLNRLRTEDQTNRERGRETFNRGLEYVGIIGGLIIAGRSESALGQIGGAVMGAGSMAARAYTYSHPVECSHITADQTFDPIVKIAPTFDPLQQA